MKANTRALAHVASARSVTTNCEAPPPPLALDAADALPVLMLPEGLLPDAEALVAADAEALARESGSHQALRRILGVEIGVRHVQLRVRDAAYSALFEQYARGGGDPARLRVLDDLLTREQSRLLAAVLALHRVSGGGGRTIVSVRANQAAIALGGNSP